MNLLNLIKFISILFVPNAMWYQRFLLFSLFFFISFIQQILKKDKKYKNIYLFISILFIIVGLIDFLYTVRF
jgi:flagellar biosynthesis protein FlhB